MCIHNYMCGPTDPAAVLNLQTLLLRLLRDDMCASVPPPQMLQSPHGWAPRPHHREICILSHHRWPPLSLHARPHIAGHRGHATTKSAFSPTIAGHREHATITCPPIPTPPPSQTLNLQSLDNCAVAAVAAIAAARFFVQKPTFGGQTSPPKEDSRRF